MEPLNTLDVIISIGFALSMLIAFIRGFVKEVLSILGLVIFIALSVYLAPLLSGWMNQYIESKTLSYIVIVLIIMAIFYTIWIISTEKLIAKIRTSTLSFMDRLLGLIFGLLRAMLILGFCFLVVKVTLPEELKEPSVEKSKYLIIAQSCSDLIERMLPDEFIQNTIKSIEKMNKVEKKKETQTESKNEKDGKAATKSSSTQSLPSELDQKQMNEMFEKLVNPEVKKDKDVQKKSESKPKESKGYDKKETNSLDRLIDLTSD